MMMRVRLKKKAKQKKKASISRARTPPWPDYPEWSTAKFWGFIRAGLRSKASRWPPKYEVKREAQRVVTGQRHRYEYQCSECEGWFKDKEVEVDHIVPVGSLKSWEDLVPFTQRMFCAKEGLRVVCKTCHKAKTQAERKT